MSALAFWKAVVQDESNFLERVIGLLDDGGFRYCVIGGVGVNAYVEPECRASKRQKDLADISRLLEAFPELRSRVPQTLLERLF